MPMTTSGFIFRRDPCKLSLCRIACLPRLQEAQCAIAAVGVTGVISKGGPPWMGAIGSLTDISNGRGHDEESGHLW